MSVTFLDEYQADPCKAVRRQLEALWKLDADRVAFGRQQRVGAVKVASETSTSAPSVMPTVANHKPATPPASGPAKEF